MDELKAAEALQRNIESLSYLEVVERNAAPENVTLFCRLSKGYLDVWKGAIKEILMREAKVNKEGREVAIMIAQRYTLREDPSGPRFGYLWQISLWARNLEMGVGLFAGFGPPAEIPAGADGKPKPLPQLLESMPLRARATQETAIGADRFPVNRGARGTPYGG